MQIMALATAREACWENAAYVWVSSEFSIWGGTVCVGVCVCVRAWKGHKHTHTHGYALTIHQQLFSIANPQLFGEVLVTPMGKML